MSRTHEAAEDVVVVAASQMDIVDVGDNHFLSQTCLAVQNDAFHRPPMVSRNAEVKYIQSLIANHSPFQSSSVC